MNNEDKFIGYVEGYLCTTDIDSHGDKLTSEVVEDMKKQMDKNPKLRTLYLEHDTNQPIGIILESKIEIKNKWRGLKVKAGIFQGREDVWKRIKNGKLGGFSIGTRVLRFEQTGSIKQRKDGNHFNERYTFSLEVSPQWWVEIKNLLDKEETKSEVYLKKGIDFPTVIWVIASSLTIIDKLYRYWKSNKEKGKNINISIVIKNNKFNFNRFSPEEIKKYFKNQNNEKQ